MKKHCIYPLIVFVFALISCKKSRSCECTTTPNYTTSNGPVYFMGPNGPITTTKTSVYKKVRKADMKTLCGNSTIVTTQTLTNADGSLNILTNTTETTCKLK